MNIEIPIEAPSRWWESDDSDTKDASRSSVLPTKKKRAQLPAFEFPLRSSSIFPSSPCETLCSNTSQAPPRATGSYLDDSNSVTDVESVHPRKSDVPDGSFWATSAALLGPDFDLNSRTLVERVDAARPGRDADSGCGGGLNDSPQSSAMPGIPQELIISLESLGVSWKWFTEGAQVQNYVSNRIPATEKWDFGVCLARGDGQVQCLVMHARGYARTYSEPAPLGGARMDARMVASCSKPMFWWCRPYSQWDEENRDHWAKGKEMDTHYANAKQNIAAFNSFDTPKTRLALLQSRQDLLKDFKDRERATGHYSVATMNTILQLSIISESLSSLEEAELWTAELIRRRIARTGPNSEHTCAARCKYAQFLLLMQRFEEAKSVAAKNVEGLRDLPRSHILVIKQNILDRAIACKTGEHVQALEVVGQLRIIERFHPNNRALKELGLQLLVDTHTLRGDFERAEEYLRRQIALYDASYGSKTSLGRLYYSLGSVLYSQSKNEDSLRELRKSALVYKVIGLEMPDEEVVELNILLAENLTILEEWSKARQCWENVADGALLTFGRQDSRAVLARKKIEALDDRWRSRGGLAGRFLKYRDKEKRKGKE